MPGLAAGGMAAADLAGTLLTNSANEQMTAENNQTQIQLQQQAEAYNTQMSDTSYQRGMADMQAAGLNPMLAMGNGGASTPTAPMPVTQAGHAENALASAAQGAAQGATTAAQVQQSQAQTSQAQSQTAVNAAQVGKISADTALSKTANDTARASLQAVTDESALRSANAKTGLKYQGADQFMNRLKAYSNSASSAVGAVTGLGAIGAASGGGATAPGYVGNSLP